LDDPHTDEARDTPYEQNRPRLACPLAAVRKAEVKVMRVPEAMVRAGNERFCRVGNENRRESEGHPEWRDEHQRRGTTFGAGAGRAKPTCGNAERDS
jgi:hypothetical protein